MAELQSSGQPGAVSRIPFITLRIVRVWPDSGERGRVYLERGADRTKEERRDSLSSAIGILKRWKGARHLALQSYLVNASTCIGNMVEVLDTVLTGRTGVYASSPITSGRRLLNLRSTRGISKEEDIDEAVIRPNLEAGLTFASQIRKRFGNRVIDPTRLPFLKEWSQDHYYALWSEVVQTRTEFAVFNEDWEYSSGCTYEYVVAAISGVETLDSLMHSLPVDEAVRRIKAAISAMDNVGIDSTYLRIRVSQLSRSATDTLSVEDPSCAIHLRAHWCALALGCVVPERSVFVLADTDIASETGQFPQVRVHPEAFRPSGWAPCEIESFWKESLRRYCETIIDPRTRTTGTETALLVRCASELGLLDHNIADSRRT